MSLQEIIAANTNKLWTKTEERDLLCDFDAGWSINFLARDSGRSVAAIVACLEKNDKVINRDGKVFSLLPLKVDWSAK